MPYRYRVFPSQQLGIITVYGAVSGETVIEAATALSNDEAWSPDFDRLWDAREVTHLDMSPDHVHTLIRQTRARIQMEGPGRAARGAIVTTRELDATMASLFKMALRKDRAVERFRTMEEALTWLGKETPVELGGHGESRTGQHD